jgi:hypothetical protein
LAVGWLLIVALRLMLLLFVIVFVAVVLFAVIFVRFVGSLAVVLLTIAERLLVGCSLAFTDSLCYLLVYLFVYFIRWLRCDYLHLRLAVVVLLFVICICVLLAVVCSLAVAVM